MGVIYCDECNIGVHYTDVCPGGANGHPRKSKQQIRKEQNKINLQAFLLVTTIIVLAITIATWSN